MTRHQLEEGKPEHVHGGENSKSEGFEVTKILVHFRTEGRLVSLINNE